VLFALKTSIFMFAVSYPSISKISHVLSDRQIAYMLGLIKQPKLLKAVFIEKEIST
jgi:hypothetical protein